VTINQADTQQDHEPYRPKPLTIGAILIVVFLCVVLASTSTQISQIASVVEANSDKTWEILRERDREELVRANDFTISVGKLEMEGAKLILGAEHLAVAAMAGNIAAAHLSRKEFAESQRMSQLALDIRLKRLGETHPYIVQNLINLAYLEAIQSRFQKAEELLLRAQKIQRQIVPVGSAEEATILSNLGYVYIKDNKYPQAVAAMQQAVDVLRNIYPPDSINIAYGYNNLTNVYLSNQDFVAAEQQMKQALPILEKNLGRESPTYMASLLVYAQLKKTLRQNEEALKLLRECLDVHRRVDGAGHPSVAIVLNELGEVQSALGDHDNAQRCFVEALGILNALKTDDRHVTATKIAVLESYAKLMEADGHVPEAAKLRDQAKALQRALK
jgi:tetratricopeptide (TPR) repeat protein